MRLEHHLVGGYVRYMSPYIIIIILRVCFLRIKKIKETKKIKKKLSISEIKTCMLAHCFNPQLTRVNLSLRFLVSARARLLRPVRQHF